MLPSERKEITVPAAVLSSYAGTYELAPGFSIAITLENGQLMEQATNQPKFPIFAESPTRFFLKVVDAQIEFVKNDKGEVNQMILHQGGRDMKGVRKLASERKEITVPPAVLSSYAGTYELAPGFSIAITLENGQLMEQATNQPKFPLFAESPTRFFLKVVDAQIEFIKNDKGEVNALVLHQNGRDIKGVRK
ncbi:MAG: DUF3471 domain-containing protein [Silvibacterium sp.]|nr:DUF3471 domain-containing protein [Silvibacterium sp.]